MFLTSTQAIRGSLKKNFPMKTVWWFLKKLKTKLSYEPTITLMGIYSKRIESRHSKRQLYSHVNSSITRKAKRWTQPK